MLHRFDLFGDYDWNTRIPMAPRWFMASDVYQGDDNYYVEIDVPGVAEDQIDVTLDRKTLTVAVNRAHPAHEEWTSVMRGRPFGTFTRRFYLSDGLDSDGIQATLDNGVLTLAIPMLETAKARKIEIGTVHSAISS